MTTEVNPENWESIPRKVVATIEVVVRTTDKKDMYQAASNRKRDLEDWLKRHLKDIKNEMSYLDEVSFSVNMEVAEE